MTAPSAPPADQRGDGHRRPWRDRLGVPPGVRERLPLRIRLVAAVLALVVVALVAFGVAATTALRGYLVGQVDSQLQSIAQTLSQHPLACGSGDAVDRYRLPGENYIEVLGPVAANGSCTVINPSVPGPRLPAYSAGLVQRRALDPFTVSAVSGGGSWRVVLVPVVVQPTNAVVGGVAVATSLDTATTTVHKMVYRQLLVGLAILIVLGLVGYELVRRSLRPLVEVESTAAAIAAGDLSRRVPDRDPRTEVGRLSRALNGMLAQIESAFRAREASESAARRSEERMRRFVTDASHELRTPLTSIRGFAELYRQGAATRPEDRARLLRRIEDEAARMGLLVEDMLLLARLDQQRPLQRHPVDLLTLATDAVHDARAVDRTRSVTLELLEGSAPPVVTGDEHRLRQVVGNLMSNALTHTPPGTPVSVRLGSAADPGDGPGWAVLEVADRGPGLSPADADRVFERFYRADPSRSRGRGGGSGLGLSIVAALVAAHGGRVELETAPGAGATFRVRLPLLGGGPAGGAGPSGGAASANGAGPGAGTADPAGTGSAPAGAGGSAPAGAGGSAPAGTGGSASPGAGGSGSG